MEQQQSIALEDPSVPAEESQAATEVASKPTARPHEPFFYSQWLHVGPNAEACGDAETGTCGDPLHFHAWLRLPNPIQHREIQEKAAAAKARRQRQLRDPECDQFAILENQLAELAATGDTEGLVEEIVAPVWWRDQLDAFRSIEDEDEDGKYKAIAEDESRLYELEALHTQLGGEPDDELTELRNHVEGFRATLQARMKARQEKRAEPLRGKPVDELIDFIRKDRIDAAGNEEFMHVYALWEWIYCTRRTMQGPQIFESVDDLREIAPEVVEAIKAAFDELETAQSGESAKN